MPCDSNPAGDSEAGVQFVPPTVGKGFFSNRKPVLCITTMPIPLSKRCRRVAERLFSEPSHFLGSRSRLTAEASENIPFHANSNSTEMDRIRFAIMKLASIPCSDEDAIFALAKTDWKTCSWLPGFGTPSREQHEKWYQSLVPQRFRAA